MTLKIHIVKNITDPFLKSEWERLARASDVFPQSTYHWCATWWKYLSGKRKLYVVMVLGENGKALGIAPLCVERHFGIPVLRSFPINFSDFYTFLVQPGNSAEAVYETLLKHINSRKDWYWVRIEKVSQADQFSIKLAQNGYLQRKMTACVLIDFSGLDWHSYLLRLKAKRRWNINKQLKEIRNGYDAKLEMVTTYDDFMPFLDEMILVHAKRWKEDNLSKSPKVSACWREAIEGQFLKGSMIYCRLALNGKVAAYHLGFMHRNIFYDWHISFEPEFARNQVGVMILGFMIPQFMERKIEKINYMAGEYDWKLAWSPDRRTEANYMFTSPSNNIAAFFLNGYHHNLREKLKAGYYKMMKYHLLRSVSRRAIWLRQKLAGLR